MHASVFIAYISVVLLHYDERHNNRVTVLNIVVLSFQKRNKNIFFSSEFTFDRDEQLFIVDFHKLK